VRPAPGLAAGTRLLLFTGKGGVGKTTTAAATALQLAERGVKTLVLSTDAAHSLGDALERPLTDQPLSVVPGLDAAQLNTRHRWEAAWTEVADYLRQLLLQGELDPIAAEELTVLPGIEEVLALLAVGELAGSGRWDVIVLDCAPTAETLRLLALPEALGWYLDRVFPVHRKLARGLRPMSSLLGRDGLAPPDAVFDAVVRMATELAEVRALLADPATTSIRLVLTPQAVVAAEARRTLTALALHGYPVAELIVNRVLPAAASDSQWGRPFWQAQQEQLAAITADFAGLPIRRLSHRAVEPVGPADLLTLGGELYAEEDPAAATATEPLLQVLTTGEEQFQLLVRLPLADRRQVSAARSGDELVLTVGEHRRVLTLPSVLRRCRVVAGEVADGLVRLEFEPDPALWPRPARPEPAS